MGKAKGRRGFPGQEALFPASVKAVELSLRGVHSAHQLKSLGPVAKSACLPRPPCRQDAQSQAFTARCHPVIDSRPCSRSIGIRVECFHS